MIVGSYTEELELLDDVATVDCYDLVVFNDEHNTFEHVIDTLIKVCKHTFMQAEQCTLLIHHKGKCKVKSGEYEQLSTMRTAICDRGIMAEVL